MNAYQTINQVAKRTGLTAYTLRYYERIGLLAPVARAAGGQRLYAPTDMAWLDFLLRLRTTHMTIGKMQIFAQLRSAGDATVAQRRQMLESHLQEVQAEVVAMQNAVAALQVKIDYYRGLEAGEDVSHLF
ncbi:MerR family transcriptional regulator [Pseudomonas sp. LARHCG127]|uniref:MerR family transcriptional regulator n=1 Tax=unclassified Pseudomonas TaxID=196821 RepID=UPI003984F2BD